MPKRSRCASPGARPAPIAAGPDGPLGSWPIHELDARHDGQDRLAIVEALAAGIRSARLLILPGGHAFINDPDGPLPHIERLWRAPTGTPAP